MNSREHNTDIGAIIYEYDSWSCISKNASEGMKLSYYILTNALMISIDHSQPQKDSHTYNQLRINMHKANPSTDLEFPDILSLGSFGGGTHRKYCHQGFFSKGLNEYRKNIWEFRKNSILIPAVAIAFNIDKDNAVTSTIAIISYYLHMLGDLYTGNSRYMDNINSYPKLLHKFSEDLKSAAEGITCNHSKLDIMINTLDKVAYHPTTIKYSNQYNTGAMYHLSKNYLKNSVPAIIEELISIKPHDIDLFQCSQFLD